MCAAVWALQAETPPHRSAVTVSHNNTLSATEPIHIYRHTRRLPPGML